MVQRHPPTQCSKVIIWIKGKWLRDMWTVPMSLLTKITSWFDEAFVSLIGKDGKEVRAISIRKCERDISMPVPISGFSYPLWSRPPCTVFTPMYHFLPFFLRFSPPPVPFLLESLYFSRDPLCTRIGICLPPCNKIRIFYPMALYQNGDFFRTLPVTKWAVPPPSHFLM